MSDKEIQKDEICALQSIYNEEEIQVNEENGIQQGVFYAYIDLPSGFKVVYRDLRQEDSSLQEFSVKYLPPLCLHFSLPEDYPSRSPPTYKLSCQWLRNNKLMLLSNRLDEIWKESEFSEILFLWTQFLKEESLNHLELMDTLDISLLETTFLAHEELKQARRAQQLEAEAKKIEETPAEPAKEESSAPATRPVITEFARRRFRGGRPRWHGRDRYARYEGYNTSATQEHRNDGRVMFYDSRKKGFFSRPPRSRGSYGRGSSVWSGRSDPKVGSSGTSDSAREDVLPRQSEPIVLEDNSTSQCDNIDVDKVSSNHVEKQDDVPGSDLEEVASRERRSSSVSDRPRMSVVRLLEEYNEARQRTEFNRNFYTCKICFQDKMGSQCTCFEGCKHVFCKSCIAEYFEVRIKDGTVKNIYCPEDKCTSEALPSQVQELVSAELFSHYDSVLLSSLLDTMEDVLYCPRPACQYPVAMEPGEKMATCPSCGYAFCVFCKMVYHGIEPCRFRAHEKRVLVEEYNSASEERKTKMEQRYGKKQLQALVDTYLSETWLDSNSKKCPNCSSNIEKSDGCNKMVCWKCNTFFCWLCEERLNPKSPYMHFNNPASKCHNLLFHGVPLSDDEDDDDPFWVPVGHYLRRNN